MSKGHGNNPCPAAKNAKIVYVNNFQFFDLLINGKCVLVNQFWGGHGPPWPPRRTATEYVSLQDREWKQASTAKNTVVFMMWFLGCFIGYSFSNLLSAEEVVEICMCHPHSTLTGSLTRPV